MIFNFFKISAHVSIPFNYFFFFSRKILPPPPPPTPKKIVGNKFPFGRH